MLGSTIKRIWSNVVLVPPYLQMFIKYNIVKNICFKSMEPS